MAEIITIARPYAEAVFETAREQDALQEWSAQLQLLAAVVTHPEVAEIISRPGLNKAERAALVNDICEGRLAPGMQSLVQLLAENDRLPALPEITLLYEEARAEAERRINARVTSASALDKSQCEAIVSALEKRLGREVSLECTLDETLVGGAVIQAGDLVIDGSVAGQLDKLNVALLR